LRPLFLVVEDEPGIADMIEQLVEPLDVETATAGDGADAIALLAGPLAARQPALCLVDLVMPHVDGFAVIEAVRSRADLDDTPIAVLSALPDAEVLRRAFALGATDFMLKPFRLDVFHEHVRQLLAPPSGVVNVVAVIEQLLGLPPLRGRYALRVEEDLPPAAITSTTRLRGALANLLLGGAVLDRRAGERRPMPLTVGRHGDDARLLRIVTEPGAPLQRASAPTRPARSMERAPLEPLGVRLAARLVAALDGRLAVESSAESFSFDLVLPAAR
jgi:CheY-like chemotaxis protein